MRTRRFVCVGIDENGLGPRLGPLVVTAIRATVTERGLAHLEAAPGGEASARLGDSKRLVSYGDSALGEAWARAIVERVGARPDAPAALLRAVAIDGDDVLRARCPDAHAAQCWSDADEGFAADVAVQRDVRRDLDGLARAGVDVQSAHVAIVCVERLWDASRRGLSRLDVNLHAMERLALAAAGDETDARIACGKVGGFDRYLPPLGPLAERSVTTLVEGRDRSEYAFAGLGRVAFLRDAEDRHLLIAMASLVGKWARDLLMARIVRYHRGYDATLPDASGYNDPVTGRFVAQTEHERARRSLPVECFERPKGQKPKRRPRP